MIQIQCTCADVDVRPMHSPSVRALDASTSARVHWIWIISLATRLTHLLTYNRQIDVRMKVLLASLAVGLLLACDLLSTAFLNCGISSFFFFFLPQKLTILTARLNKSLSISGVVWEIPAPWNNGREILSGIKRDFRYILEKKKKDLLNVFFFFFSIFYYQSLTHTPKNRV